MKEGIYSLSDERSSFHPSGHDSLLDDVWKELILVTRLMMESGEHTLPSVRWSEFPSLLNPRVAKDCIHYTFELQMSQSVKTTVIIKAILGKLSIKENVVKTEAMNMGSLA